VGEVFAVVVVVGYWYWVSQIWEKYGRELDRLFPSGLRFGFAT
jgi:hypothetical protein